MQVLNVNHVSVLIHVSAFIQKHRGLFFSVCIVYAFLVLNSVELKEDDQYL